MQNEGLNYGEGQDEFIMRKLDNVDVGLGEDYKEALADVGCNADDLYVVNQDQESREHRFAP